ncbi:MAG: hypothetical protein JWL90_1923 [Chthoniobacteraceae bacterium]|nr:hypothetical protein [Chthoniobacteraceae bacterium]
MSGSRTFVTFVCGSLLLNACLIGHVLWEPVDPQELTPQPSVAAASVIAETAESERAATQTVGASQTETPFATSGAERFIPFVKDLKALPDMGEITPVEVAAPRIEPVDAQFDIAEATESERVSQISAGRRGGRIALNALPAVAVDPTAPGTSMAVGGNRVTVENVVLSPEGKNVGLDLVIEPESAQVSAEVSAGSSLKRWRERNKKTGGFTEEEALFRMRWGWEAFAQAERNAAETPSATR